MAVFQEQLFKGQFQKAISISGKEPCCMKLDYKLGIKLAGVWFLLWGLNGLGIFNVGRFFGPLLPLIALAAGVLILMRS